jgi:hypothetical protein
LWQKFIQTQINYSRLPKSDKPVTVYVNLLNVNEKGKIDSVKVLRGVSDIYDNEAMRVIKLIPEWDILYCHGKRVPSYSLLPVTFYPIKPKPLEYQLPPKAAKN